MPIKPVLLERIIREEYEKLLNEFVVPVTYSLSDWKAYRKKNKISNAEYHREHPETRWKVVHGHKEGEIGKSLKGLSDLSYEKATKAHAAIAMRNEVVASPPLGGSGTTTQQQPQASVPTGKLDPQRSVSASQLKQAQLTQAQSDAKTAQAEVTAYERSLILDLENKFRELASIPDVDLIKIRPRIEQMLKMFYKTFSPQIASSQSGNKTTSSEQTPVKQQSTAPGGELKL